jgi:CheY-like chemotaxis protein
MRVLYVDDDRVNLLLFSEACRIAGNVQLETAVNGAEALELVADFQPELLVIDLHLPDIDGCTLLPLLRQRAGQAELPAALCSADDPAETAARAREAGFQHCWPKPLDLAQVLAMLAAPPGGASPSPSVAG